MARYIAFLRAINVGGRVVKMDQLRRLFEQMGFSGVETFIASGNVIFEAQRTAGLETRIENGLLAALGYSVETFVRTPAELAAILGDTPFTAADAASAHSLYVGFLRNAPAGDPSLIADSLRTESDDFRFHGRELYWLLQRGQNESKVSLPALQKRIGGPVTFRTIKTVERLLAKYPAS